MVYDLGTLIDSLHKVNDDRALLPYVVDIHQKELVVSSCTHAEIIAMYGDYTVHARIDPEQEEIAEITVSYTHGAGGLISPVVNAVRDNYHGVWKVSRWEMLGAKLSQDCFTIEI